jgi:signal transduction histidine kinase
MDSFCARSYDMRMKNVLLVLAAASVTLLLAQGALLLARIPFVASRKNPLLLAATLFLLAAARIASPGSLLHEAVLLAALVAGGIFVSRPSGGRRRLTWFLAGVAAMLVVAAAVLPAYKGSLPLLAFRSFTVAGLAVALLWDVLRIARSARSPAALLTCACGVLWLAGGAVRAAMEATGGDAALAEGVPGLMACICTGWLVFQEGYPLKPGWGGGLESGYAVERAMQSMTRRLRRTEDALALQDRAAASGVLAVGAAHEFKNILSHVRLASRHALDAQSVEEKNAGLRLLLELAGTGADAAVGLLERIASEGRQDPSDIEPAQDLSPFIAMLRASFRGEGIVLKADLGGAPRISARAAEVEQILLNVVRNAAACYRTNGLPGKRAIVISGRHCGEWGILCVEDEAGGVPAGLVGRLFAPDSSGVGSTGLGLWLARSLAASNGGTLDYQPTERGSLFTLALPAAADWEGAFGDAAEPRA